MTKLIQKNPYALGELEHIWAAGFEAGQKSTLAPVSVTGRWWQSGDGKVWFVPPEEYKSVQRTTDNNPKICRWLTEEKTREFT